MFINIIINILSIILFYKSPIRFSSKKLIYKLNINKLYTYLIYTLIVIHSYSLYKIISFKCVIQLFISIFIINIIDKTNVIDDDSFNPPPNYISRNTILYLIIILLLLYNFSYYLFGVYLFLFVQHYSYTTCIYELPQSWNLK